eukprot:474692_1
MTHHTLTSYERTHPNYYVEDRSEISTSKSVHKVRNVEMAISQPIYQDQAARSAPEAKRYKTSGPDLKTTKSNCKTHRNHTQRTTKLNHTRLGNSSYRIILQQMERDIRRSTNEGKKQSKMKPKQECHCMVDLHSERTRK